jgi:hypothetical protein
LKTLEERVQYLIDLLEKCKAQLGYISESESNNRKDQAIDTDISEERRENRRMKEIEQMGDSLGWIKKQVLKAK